MAEHIASNPQFIVNEFIQLGIACALDNLAIDDDSDGAVLHPSDDKQDSEYKEVPEEESDNEEFEQ